MNTTKDKHRNEGGGNEAPLGSLQRSISRYFSKPLQLKAFALFAVSLMLLTSFSCISDLEESDATYGDVFHYTLTLNGKTTDTNGNAFNIVTVHDNINNINMSPITSLSTNSPASASANSWTWNATTGIGPFNSFYALYAARNENGHSAGDMLGVLNPLNLSKYIDGTSAPITSNNVMWILPKLYMKYINDTTYDVSNDYSRLGLTASNKDSYAMAHYYNDTTYEAIGIGVYEAYYDGSTGIAMSASGKTPVNNLTRAQWRDYAAADNFSNGTTGVLWNWYQYNTYRILTEAVVGNLNTRVFAYSTYTYSGPIKSDITPYSSEVNTTGSTNQSNQGYYGCLRGQVTSRVFLENSWGGIKECIDGTISYSGQAYIISKNYALADTDYVNQADGTITTYSGPGLSPSYLGWGLSSMSGYMSTGTSGTTKYYVKTDMPEVYKSTDGGLAELGLNGLTSSVGARIACYFTKAPSPFPTNTVTIDYNLNYLSLSGGTGFDVRVGDSITINNNTLTYSGNIIAATPTSGYRFSSWTVSGASISGTYTPTTDVTITANVVPDTITVTFYKGSSNNLQVITTQIITKGTSPTLFTPDVGSQVFVGWFEDVAHTQQFNPSTTLTSDIPLYCYAVDALQFSSSPVANATFDNVMSLGMMVFDATRSLSAHHILWDFGDGHTSTDKIAYHVYQSPGTYDVKLSVYNSLGEVDMQEYQVTISESNVLHDSDNTFLYVGVAITAIVTLFVITRIF